MVGWQMGQEQENVTVPVESEWKALPTHGPINKQTQLLLCRLSGLIAKFAARRSWTRFVTTACESLINAPEGKSDHYIP